MIVISYESTDDDTLFSRALGGGKVEPCLFIVPQRRAIAEVIESLLLVWAASRAAEWRDAIVYLPFR